MTNNGDNPGVCICLPGRHSQEQLAKKKAREDRLAALCAEHGVDRADRRAVYLLVKSMENPGQYMGLLDFSDTL
jgi:hypothetical protein